MSQTPEWAQNTVGASFSPLFAGPFLHDFGSSDKEKKGHSRISEEKITKISDFVFLFGSFFYKREIVAYFCLYFKFAMFFIRKTLHIINFIGNP